MIRSADSPFLADWFSISLRWLALLGMAVALTFAGMYQPVAAGVLFFAAVWNVFVSFLAILNKRLPSHRLLNPLLDGICATLLFASTGGVGGPLSWVALLPLFSSAIYYEWKGSLLAAVLVSLFQWTWSALLGSSASAWGVPMGMITLFNLGMAAVLGFLSSRLILGVRASYQQRVRTQQEAEASAKQQEYDRMQPLFKLISTLTASLNYERVLETALDLSLTVLDESNEANSRMVSAVMIFDGDQLAVASARRFTPADMRTVLPAREGILAQTIQNTEPQYCKNPSADPELMQIVSFHNCPSLVCLPLRLGLNVYGVLIFAHSEPNYFTNQRVDLLRIISQQAVQAIQNARLYQDLEAEKQRMIAAQEEARNKLARDLHDGPTQSVSAIAMRVNYTRKLMEKDVHAAADELVKIEELARRTTKEIRLMLFTLRPLVLESQGLVAALQDMATKMQETYNQTVQIDVDEAVVEELELNKQTIIFYIAEEATNNARKHAEAAVIWVRLKPIPREPNIARLEIADNGVGFDVQAVNSNYDRRGSLGMVNLRERSELLNGLLHIESAPGRGTHVQVFIPLNEEAADRLHRAV